MKLSTIYGAIAIACLLVCTAAVDSYMPLTAAVLMIGFTIFIAMAMYEEGELHVWVREVKDLLKKLFGKDF